MLFSPLKVHCQFYEIFMNKCEVQGEEFATKNWKEKNNSKIGTV
jgi:hypothetical protein